MSKPSPFGSLSRGLVQGAMILLCLASILPLYNVIGASLKSADEYAVNPILLPEKVVWDNYSYAALDAGLLRYAVNSFLYVPAALCLYILVCVCSGYAFGKLRFAFRRPIFLLVLFLSIFPQLLLATQVFKLVSLMKLTNTGLGVILAWVAYFAPFGTYMMTTYYSDMPYELVEAARIDGASQYRILSRVMAPMAAPMISTIAIIGFQSMWNELPFSLLILQGQKVRTLTVGVAMMRGEFGLRVPIQSAALVIAMAVPLLVFIVFQRRITLGATAGALKG